MFVLPCLAYPGQTIQIRGIFCKRNRNPPSHKLDDRPEGRNVCAGLGLVQTYRNGGGGGKSFWKKNGQKKNMFLLNQSLI